MVSKLIKALIGIILVLLGAWLVYLWQVDLLALIRGSLGLILVLFGLIAFALIAD
ncbi:MAG: hypothetical protein KKC80_03940 [Candidatus Margulisbacteria bacterium]|nr:hypothetical protein [Candidatus Margulisiibacteriota bacterium]MBU1616710.1 hypothetical protein [Candidatus Margulisiibacteriota bacterium]MBU1867265.1 hypothetical protein [Candidatus Margulisiibacteriota bacterium]